MTVPTLLPDVAKQEMPKKYSARSNFGGDGSEGSVGDIGGCVAEKKEVVVITEQPATLTVI